MAKLTKKAKLIKEKVEPGKSYDANGAFSLLKELSAANFVESVDVSVNLGIDARKSDQAVRGATTLPHGTGKDVKVLALVTPDKEAPTIPNATTNQFELLFALKKTLLLSSLLVRYDIKVNIAKYESTVINIISGDSIYL